MIFAIAKMLFGNLLTASIGWLGWQIGVHFFKWNYMNIGEAFLGVTLIWFVIYCYNMYVEKISANEVTSA